MAVLVILSGLPGVGKSTISRYLAGVMPAVWLRVDTIEQGLRDSGLADEDIGGKGYVVADRLAEENLRLGLHCILDTVNPWNLTREWHRRAAIAAGAAFMDVEIVCSDEAEHRRRIEARTSDIAGLRLPTWDDVVAREYKPWTQNRLVVDTASESIAECAHRILHEARQVGAEGWLGSWVSDLDGPGGDQAPTE